MPHHPDPNDLAAYHDGELSGEAAEAVRRHLESCARCAEDGATLAKITGLMTAETPAMPAGLRGRIERAAAQRSVVTRERWWPRIAAAAAGALLVLGVASQALPDSAEEAAVPVTRGRSEAHPVEVLLTRATASGIAREASIAPLTRRREELVLARVMARERRGR